VNASDWVDSSIMSVGGNAGAERVEQLPQSSWHFWPRQQAPEQMSMGTEM